MPNVAMHQYVANLIATRLKAGLSSASFAKEGGNDGRFASVTAFPPSDMAHVREELNRSTTILLLVAEMTTNSCELSIGCPSDPDRGN
jgi:hypothetical protein